MRGSIIRNLEMRVKMGTSIHALIEPPHGLSTNPRPRKARIEARGAGHHTVVRGAGPRPITRPLGSGQSAGVIKGFLIRPRWIPCIGLRNTMAVQPFPLSYCAGIHGQVYSSISSLAA